MMAERAWGYAMQLKQESNTEPRKKFHLISRLYKAAKIAGSAGAGFVTGGLIKRVGGAFLGANEALDFASKHIRKGKSSAFTDA